MITIQAAQLIYSRVEAAYSPQNKDGFQTVYKSESLSSTDVNMIEKRIECFQPHQSTPVRRQFFTINANELVLTYTTQIEAHPEIIDKSSRKGAFITHCLIVDKAEFDNVNNNPFIIFDHAQFIKDAEDMVSIFGKATGTTPIKEIRIKQLDSVPACSWSGSETRKLVLLAMQAEQLSKEARSVFLLGKEGNIDETLRIIFHLLPKNKRALCTFNTCIDGCPTRPGVYWAVGANRRQSGSAYIEVKTTERRVAVPVQEMSGTQQLYLDWLKAASSQEPFEEVLEYAPTIQILCTAFADKTRPNMDKLDEEACQDFINLYQERVKSGLHEVLLKALGKALAGVLIDYVYDDTEKPLLLSIVASQHIDGEYLCSLIAEYIFAETPELPDSEWKTLRNLARQGDNTFLLYLSATLGKKIDHEARKEALRRMDQETFQKVLDLLRKPLEPAYFVTKRYLQLLVNNPRLKDMDDEEFVNLIKAIIQARASEYLNDLAEYVDIIEDKPLAQLEKLVKKLNIPRKFEEAMIARREELGASLRLLRLFRR